MTLILGRRFKLYRLNALYRVRDIRLIKSDPLFVVCREDESLREYKVSR
jgi:hypothetical protein